MRNPHSESARWTHVSRAMAIMVVIIGAAVLLSWLAGDTRETAFVFDAGPMKANSALAFVLLGVALLLLRAERSIAPPWRSRTVYAFASLVLLFALATVVEHTFALDLRVDELVFRDPGSLLPGRPSAATALLFAFAALALLAFKRRTPEADLIGQALAGATVFSALLAFVAYAFDLSMQGDVAPYVSMPPHTSIAFVFLGTGLLLARPSALPMEPLLRDLPSARLARGMILAIALLLPAVGWLCLEGQQRGWFGREFGAALMVVASITLLTAVLWFSARRANLADAHVQRLRRLYAALSRTNRTITRLHDRQQLLDGICRIAVEQGGFRFAWVAWTNPEFGRLDPAAEANAPAGFIESSLAELRTSTRLREALTQRLARDVPIFVDDVADDALTEPRVRALEAVEVRSVALMPILVANRLVAVLFVYSGERGIFEEEERALLVEMANDIGFALEHLQHGEEHRMAVAALEQTESRLASILTSLYSGVWSADPRTRSMLYVNPAFERIFGLTAAQLLADPALRFRDIHPEDREEVAGAYYASLERDGSAAVEYRLRRADGEVRWIHDRGWAVREASGVVRFDGIASDVTERRRTEEEIRALNATLERRVAERTAQLEMANRELDAFSYSVSHDLRAPLRAIEGFSALLQERIATRLDEEELGFLQRVRRAVDRMSSLIEGMLQLARLTTQPLARARVDLSACAREIAEELQRDAPERRVEWMIERGIEVEGDPPLLRAVMQNLLGNAWKFTGRASAPRIEVGSLEGEDGDPVIFVRDNGAGFDMAFSDRLFDAFHRMHGEQEFPGSGIGLATVKRILTRHGGRIWAEARPGVGATFYFTLGGSAGPGNVA